jgi:RNA polymerase sigma-70 factor (ECF subfamily)
MGTDNDKEIRLPKTSSVPGRTTDEFNVGRSAADRGRTGEGEGSTPSAQLQNIFDQLADFVISNDCEDQSSRGEAHVLSVLKGGVSEYCNSIWGGIWSGLAEEVANLAADRDGHVASDKPEIEGVRSLLRKAVLQSRTQELLPMTTLEESPSLSPSGIAESDGGGPAAIFPNADASEEAESTEPDVAARGWVDWSLLVERIKKGEESAMEDLYQLFARGIRFYLCRHLGPQELDDKVHDTFLIVVQAIRRGDLRDPERLMGFVRTVVRRQVAAHIDHVVNSRRDELHIDMGVRIADARRNPEQNAALREKTALMIEVLRQMSERDRDLLTRFYLEEQSQEQICKEMRLTQTQYRLLMSRAKARFGELGQKRLAKKGLWAAFLRMSADTAE